MKKILLIATSFLIFSATSAIACKCIQSTPEESFERAGTVFSGRVVDVVEPSPAERQSPRGNEDPNFLSGVKVTFEVSEVWKGNNKQRLVVMTSDSSASCGYSFQEGEEYLVYASGEEAKLQTGLCSGTKPLSDARADLGVLGEGETPTERSNEQLQQNRQLWRSEKCRYTVTSKTDNSGKPVNREYFKQYNSIPKLFNLVRSAIAKDVNRLSVTYHPSLGYPTQISIDYDAQMADEEQYLTIENLEVIR
jgi:hypothetical protein